MTKDNIKPECRARFVSKMGMSAIVLSVCAILTMITIAGFSAWGDTKKHAEMERHQNDRAIAVIETKLSEMHSAIKTIDRKLENKNNLLERLVEVLEHPPPCDPSF